MAVVCTKQTFYRYSGLSTDVKPVAGVEDSSTFDELDTGRRFEMRGKTWQLIQDIKNFKISDLDTSSTTKYFGFIDSVGHWYIMQLTGAAARYCFGKDNYTTNWSNRAVLTYRHLHQSIS